MAQLSTLGGIAMTNTTQKILGYISLPLFLAVGGFGSVWCFNKHVCMGGHMQHPPYPASDYIIDVLWTLVLAAIPYVSFPLRLFGRFWWLTAVVLALPVFRFVMGSRGGCGVFGLPI